MSQTQYQKDAGLFFAMAAELRHAYREGGSAEEISELIDEIDTFCRYTDFGMIRERGRLLLAQTACSAAGNSA